MLTGALPFATADPLEWAPPTLHASLHHMVITLQSPTLSSLIMKLLAENAEERYQTASCSVLFHCGLIILHIPSFFQGRNNKI
jgi:hypothetical protein